MQAGNTDLRGPRVLAGGGAGEARPAPRGPLRRPDRADRHGGVPAGCERPGPGLGRQRAAARRRRSSGWRRRSSPQSVSSQHAWRGCCCSAAGAVWTVSLHCPDALARWDVVEHPLHRLLHRRAAAAAPGPEERLRDLPPRRPDSRAWMHASGAIITKVAPFLALAFWPASGAPWWSAAGLMAIGVASDRTDVAFSVKVSDWKKFRRERAVAEARSDRSLDAPERAAGRDLYSSTHHRGARGYRAERPAARAGDPQDLNRLMPAEGVGRVLDPRTLRVYVVTSGAFGPGRDHRTVARSAIVGGATAVQLRAPELDDDVLLPLATDLATACRDAEVLFVVNDRLDVALQSGAGGVHLGQDADQRGRAPAPGAGSHPGRERRRRGRGGGGGARRRGLPGRHGLGDGDEAGGRFHSAGRAPRRGEGARRIPVVGIGGIAASNAGAGPRGRRRRRRRDLGGRGGERSRRRDPHARAMSSSGSDPFEGLKAHERDNGRGRRRRSCSNR